MSVLVLHGAWNADPNGTSPAEGRGSGRLFLWAERIPAGRRGRRPGSGPRDGSAHPFQARPEEVREAVLALAPSLVVTGDRAAWRLVREQVRLPSFSDSPLPSPEAVRAAAAIEESGTVVASTAGAVAFAAWQVRGLVLEPARAAAFLASLPPGEKGPGGGVVLGADVRYWGAAAKLALELLARERLVPTIQREDDLLTARWRPVLDDPRDLERIAVLDRACPPCARALVPHDQTELSPRPLLESFLEESVDALARHWLGQNGTRRLSSGPASVARAWLEALTRGQTTVRAGAVDLERLAGRVSSWRAPLVTAASSSPYRTCLRIEPPPVVAESAAPKRRKGTQSQSWTISLFLQAVDDPSLLLPAAQVWRASGSTLTFLNRRFDQPQERLLADLKQAAHAFPPLDRCLSSPRPVSCVVSTEEAYRFLREAAWLLEEAGFGIQVPAWWDRRGPSGRMGLRLRMRPRREDGARAEGNGSLGRGAMLEYDWKLAVGDTELTEAEFRQLARLKVPLVQVRGQWIELRPDQIEQAIGLWEKQQIGELRAADALALALGGEEVDGLPVLSLEAEGWLSRLLASTSGGAVSEFEPLREPPGFVGKLRPYQERGAGWLRFLAEHGLGACLADDMGLGKTIQYIAFLLDRLNATPNNGHHLGPALLICPTSVIGNWRREVERFAPGVRVLVHHGQTRAGPRELQRQAARHDLIVSSYALAHRDRQALASVEWDGVVLDEAQNIKNASTLQARAIRQLRAGYRFALTGTPIENRLSELWSLFEFLNAGYLGSQNAFRLRFTTPIERWQDAERAEQLRRLVRPLILRRLKTDPAVIQDLPEKLELKVFCTLTPEQATLYQAVVSEMLGQIDASEGMQRRGLVLAALTRLKQVCNHPAHFLGDGSPLAGRSGKLSRLEEMLEEVLESGERALIFTQFAELGERLRSHLQERFGQEVLYLHGGVPASRRDGMVMRFQTEPESPSIFVLSLRAGGVGLNLTRANHVFHFDRWWNPAVEDQASDRAFRIGQRRDVQVHKYVCVGTLEEKIDALIESKKALAAQVIGADEGWLTELSNAELRDLLTLRTEAVVE